MWPTPQDYNEAIQNPRHCFSDTELCSGKVETNAIGIPKAASGSFASVYKVVTATSTYAVRCFLTFRTEQAERYQHVSEFVLLDELDCTIDFQFLEKGIKVGGQWYPILKMPWIEGPTLDLYVRQNVKNKARLLDLKNDFYTLSMALETAGIAHGDLQHGNIIVSPNGLRLVDYDVFFVPALLGRLSLEYGHPNYQHPLRDDYHFDVTVDNFSSWLIHASLTALSIDAELFEDLGGGDDSILFKRADLASPETSKAFAALSSHQSQELRELGNLLQRMLWLPPHIIPPLDATPEELANLPIAKPDFSNIQNPVLIDGLMAGAPDTALPSSSSLTKQRAESVRKKAKRPGVKKVAGSVLDSMLKVSSPGIWVSLKTNEANKLVSEGKHEEALACYLKVRELHAAAYPKETAKDLSVLLKLACCCVYLNLKNQLDNYCLLAAQLADSYSKQLYTSYSHTAGLAQFYGTIGEVLYSIARKPGEKQTDVLATFGSLLDRSAVLASALEAQRLLAGVSELIMALLPSINVVECRASMFDCTMAILRFSATWARINEQYSYLSEYGKCWTTLCSCTQALTEKLEVERLAIEAAIIARVGLIRGIEDSAFIECCLSKKDFFKAALQEVERILTFATTMNCITPSLLGLAIAQPQLFPDAVYWLWKEFVLDEHEEKLGERIAWLQDFQQLVIAKCLDDASLEIVTKKVKVLFAHEDRFIQIGKLVFASSRLGESGEPLTEKILLKMINLVKSNRAELTSREINEARQLVLMYATPGTAPCDFTSRFS